MLRNTSKQIVVDITPTLREAHIHNQINMSYFVFHINGNILRDDIHVYKKQ